MFGQIAPTEFDLHFSVFGISVRVHPMFWLGTAILGSNWLKAGIEYLLIWIAVVLVSIVVHELGHAVAFRIFRVD